MGYRTTASCLRALEERGELVRIDREVDPDLEVGAIQRRVFQAGGPAVLFTRVKGSPFPMAGNIYGTEARMRFIFRDALRSLETLVKLKVDPLEMAKTPWRLAELPRALWCMRPRKVADGPVMAGRTAVSRLPRLKSWPEDGGGYVTLPQVYSESMERPGFGKSNLGMYRVQLSGRSYRPDREVGLHYQIHRGIGPHHAEAIRAGIPLPVNIFVGGPPAMTLAAVMPLPEGMPEIFFAGILGSHRIPMVCRPGLLPILAEADFCIRGKVELGRELPEGPFGDHLGYYSLVHDFPVLTVDEVLCRKGAVWPFTTVGRPPQEDTIFGKFIHDLTAPLVGDVFNGIREVHAVDEAGVHPLLLAVGSERYVPYAAERQPQEIITGALSLLGTTQTSLSKYLLISAWEDDPRLSVRNIPAFFRHVLERADFRRDLHFITRTTMDTLDYSGISLNQGSKLILSAAGRPIRDLKEALPVDFASPDGFGDPRIFAPGVLVMKGPAHEKGRDEQDPEMERLAHYLENQKGLEGLPLIVVVDDAAFATRSWRNFLWVSFTRSDPATDIYGVQASTRCKHWGCEGSLVIDARLKTYHAKPLVDDPDIERRVDALGAPGGPLHGII